MIRWVTFDNDTSEFIAAQLHVAPELAVGGDALQSSLRVNTGTTFALLPSASDEEILLARFAWKRASKPGLSERAVWEKRNPDVSSPNRELGSQAGGFLGLSDEAVYEQEEPPAKRWWRKILD